VDHDAAHEGAPVRGVFDEDPIPVRIAAPLVPIVPRIRHQAKLTHARCHRESEGSAPSDPIYKGFYLKAQQILDVLG
jgi:hypothetical protein